MLHSRTATQSLVFEKDITFRKYEKKVTKEGYLYEDIKKDMQIEDWKKKV